MEQPRTGRWEPAAQGSARRPAPGGAGGDRPGAGRRAERRRELNGGNTTARAILVNKVSGLEIKKTGNSRS